MNNSLIIRMFFVFALTFSLELDEMFDVNDVENQACTTSCEAEKSRWSTRKLTYDELHRCSVCDKLFELCVKYRICEGDCVPEMPVLPYREARDFALRVHPPMNPCLELISACNYESKDTYHALASENPFLFI